FTTTPTPAISTLSLHDALPISQSPLDAGHVVEPHLAHLGGGDHDPRQHLRILLLLGQELHRHRVLLVALLVGRDLVLARDHEPEDRKSTRLNSSHDQISYAVFC